MKYKVYWIETNKNNAWKWTDWHWFKRTNKKFNEKLKNYESKRYDACVCVFFCLWMKSKIIKNGM